MTKRGPRAKHRAPVRCGACGTCALCRAEGPDCEAYQDADPPPFKHCDDYIDDLTSPAVLRKYLEFARAPAHGQLLPKPHPTLFADHEGRRVRVTMASRFGDVGITTDFNADVGYEHRVPISQLSNFSEDP